MPPDDLNPNYFSMTCKRSIYGVRNTIWKTAYGPGDAACLTPISPPTKFARPFTCDPQPRDAGYMQSACGDIPPSIRSRAQVLIKAYPQPGRPKPQDAVRSAVTCYSPNVVTRAYLLGVCEAYKPDGKKLLYYRKFTLAAGTTTSTIALSEARFRVADNRCSQAAFLAVQWSYSLSQSACARDPLDSSLAYAQAMYYDGNAALNWPTVDAFLRAKMVPGAPLPSPRPTPKPSTARPTAPTAPPTPALTPAPGPLLRVTSSIDGSMTATFLDANSNVLASESNLPGTSALYAFKMSPTIGPAIASAQATFTVSTRSNASYVPPQCSVLMVGGGGGGGLWGTGGGAGQLIDRSIPLAASGSFTVKVGNGGLGMQKESCTQYKGSDSSISGPGMTTLTAYGGAGGTGWTAKTWVGVFQCQQTA